MGITIKSIENWVERMERLLDYTDNQFNVKRMNLKKKCPYGDKHFCDGTRNTTIRGVKDNKPPCKHFKHGECELMLHIID